MIYSRRGVSLLELLVVMSACTVILTLTSGLLCRVMRIQVESRGHADAERNSLRLAEQFRSDVHQASAAVTSQADLGVNVFLRLKFPDGERVEYSCHDGTVRRQISGRDNAESREEFKLPVTCDVSIQDEGKPSRLILTANAKPTQTLSRGNKPLAQAMAMPVCLQVEAVLGSDSRFASAHARRETTE